MSSRFINKSELAKLAGVSPPAISKLCKGRLKSAIKNKKIDSQHPDVISYLKSKEQVVILVPPPPPSSIFGAPPPPAPTQFDDDELPATDFMPGSQISGIGDMTLIEVSRKFGTHVQLKGWLEARKKIADIEEKEIKNETMKGNLISRDFVDRFVISPFEGVFIKLLTDAKQTITKEIYTQFEAGTTVEDAEILVEKQISTHIQAAKTSVINNMKRAS